MAGEGGKQPQRASKHDSSPVILHARQTVFVMLIVSALIAMGVLAEDVARPNRAVDDAKFVASLMEFWYAETKDKLGPVSVATIVAGPVARAQETDGAFELKLTKIRKDEDEDENEVKSTMTCTVELNLERRYIVPGQGPVRDTVVERSAKVKSGGEILAVWRNFEGERLSGEWSLTRTPNDLEDFSRLWDLLISSGHSAHMQTDDLRDRISQGLILQKIEGSGTYQVDDVRDVNSTSNGEVHIVQSEDFLHSERSNFGFIDASTVLTTYANWMVKTILWSRSGFDAIAISPCRKQDVGRSDPLQYAFPVPLVKEEIDWTKAWIRRTISWIHRTKNGGELSKQLGLMMETKAGLPFSDAFSDLRSEAEGLESLALDALPKFLQERLDRVGPTFEFWGASIPSRLLRSAGMFLILIVQFYSMRHVSEAASRMESAANGDPGAFQPWIFLYDDAWSRYASLAIVVTPTMAALPIFLPLVPDAISTVNAALIWSAFLVSLGMAVSAIRLPGRLHEAARRHRTSAAHSPPMVS